MESRSSVERALLGPRFAEGRTAELYAWGAHDALKLFREGWPPEAAEHEAAVAERLYAAGVPSPMVRGVVEVEGRNGVVYERVTGPSLEDVLREKPWQLAHAVRLLAETHAAVHARPAPDATPLREQLDRRIRKAGAPAHLRDAALRRLETLPNGEALCHGDFHPGNVLLSARGPLVIDWENETRGDPLADVARTELLLRMAHIYVAHMARRVVTLGALAALIALYRRSYRRASGVALDPLAAWRLPVVVTRLSEGITCEERHLLALASRLAGSR